MFGGRRNSKSDEGKELHHSNSHGRSQSSRSRNESPPRDRDRNQRDHHDETPHRPQQPQRDTSEERRHERQRIELEHLERHRKEQEQKRKDAEREELAKKKELERKKWEREEAERKRKLAELEWKAKTALAKRLYVLLDAHCDYSAQPEVRFKAGEGQRFFNAATRACLSSMMKDSDIPTIGPADIALPGQTGEKEQVWIMSKPEDDIPEENRKNRQNLSNAYVFNSIIHFTQSGLSHPYRIDVEEATPIQNPGAIPLATDDPTNGLPPPFPLGISSAFNPVTPAPTTEDTAPQQPTTTPVLGDAPLLDESDLRRVILSSHGPLTSEWVFLSTWDSEYFFIVNVITSQFLVHNGTTIRAADLKQHRKKLREWKARTFTEPTYEELCKEIERKGIDDLLEEEWKRWMWKAEKWDNGPKTNQYRLVHSSTYKALEPTLPSDERSSTQLQLRCFGSDTPFRVLQTLPLVTESVSPLQSNNQIWTIEASAIGTDIHYSISNWSRGGTLVPQNLRIIAVPTSQEQPIQLYKILHLPTLSLLAFDAFSDTVVLVSPAKYRSEDEESVLRRVYNMTDPKDPVWGMAMWRMDEEKWRPEDGVYEISQISSSSLLTVPRFTDVQHRLPPSDPTELSLEAKDVGLPESQWWNINSRVTTDGHIYQEVTNYRSGHVININVTVDGGRDTDKSAVKGQRLGLVTGTGWVFTGTPTNRTAFSVESFTTPRKFLWGSKKAELIDNGPNVESLYRWTLTKVSLDIVSGKQYYIINWATNLLLSVNGTPGSDIPLIVSPTSPNAQRWQPDSNPLQRRYFTFHAISNGTSKGFISAPPLESDFVPDNNVGLSFPVLANSPSTDRDIDSTTWTPVKIESDIDGYSLVNPLGQALGISEVGAHEFAVILGSKEQTGIGSDKNMYFRWRFVEIDASPAPSSVVREEKYLPDGMYRIVARQSRLALSMSQESIIGRRAKRLQYPLRVELAQSLSEESYYDMWYIKRQRPSKSNPGEPEIYSIHSCAGGPLFLSVGDAAAKQKYEGIPVLANPAVPLASTAEWRITRNSALGWVIESRLVGSVLDVSEKTITTNPLLTREPTATQIWHMDPVTPSLSSGAFFITSIFSDTAIGITPAVTTNTDQVQVLSSPADSFTAPERYWRITSQPEGVYHIESLQHLQFLSQISSKQGSRKLHFTNSVEDDWSKWQLWPDIHGTYRIQNHATGEFLILNRGLSTSGQVIDSLLPAGELDLPWQRFRLTRIERRDRSWDDLPTDKILPAVYRIRNRYTKGYLLFESSSPQLHQSALCGSLTSTGDNGKAVAADWSIKASGAGFYALHSTAGYSLGQRWSTGDVVALHGFFDSTRWKLLCFDGKDYRIVNKDTGHALTASKTEGTVTAEADLGPVLTQRWELVRTASIPENERKDFTLLTREVPYPNGLYTLANVGGHGKLLVASAFGDLSVEEKIIQPYSPAIANQIWILSSADDGSGWFTLRSFVFGYFLALSTNGSIALQSRPSQTEQLGKQFHWKFIQDVVGTKISLVNRTNLPHNLGLQGNPLAARMYQRTDEDNNQRWQLVSQTGKTSDLMIVTGVYSISVYSTPGLSASSERTALIVEARAQRKRVLDAAPGATQRVADALLLNATDRLPEIDDEIVEREVKNDVANDAVTGNIIHIATSLVSILKKATLEINDSAETTDEERNVEITRRALLLESAAETIAETMAEWTKGIPHSENPVVTPVIERIMEVASTVKLLEVKVRVTPVPAPTPTVTASGDTATTPESPPGPPTPPAPTITEEVLQQAVVDTARGIQMRFQSIISVLPLSPSSTSAAGPASTTINTVITRSGDSSVLLSEHIPQSEDRLWHVESWNTVSGALCTISHLISRRVLAYRSGESGVFLAGQGDQGSSSTWKFFSSRTGGTVFITDEQQPRILTVTKDSNTLILETFDATHQWRPKAWLLSRSGYYVQNQQAGLTHLVLTSANGGSGINCAPYRPFAYDKGADPSQVWHFIKETDAAGTLRVINEQSRGTLYRTDDGRAAAAGSTLRNEADAWTLGKNGDHIWFKNEYKGRKWLQKLGDGTVGLGDPGSKEDYKGWQFVPVTGTDRAVMTVPRCALLGQPGSDVCMVYEARGDVIARPTNYEQDNSYQRFRILNFGKLSAFMNEATLRVLDAAGNAVKLEEMTEKCWFYISDNRKQITPMALNTPAPSFQEIVTTTGDLPVNKNLLRIQIGHDIRQLPLVLGLDENGNVMAIPYDPYDKMQEWHQLEWEKGRFIIHAATGKLLSRAPATSGAGVSLQLTAPPFTSQALWKLDYSSAAQPEKNGFFPLRSLDGSNLGLENATTGSTTSRTVTFNSSPNVFGCRFVFHSTAYTLTWRHIVLKTFLKTHAPVFVHASTTSVPTNIPYHEASTSSQPLTPKPGPKVYIIVRQSSEPIYLNYTDITYCLFYPPANDQDQSKGWRFITARYNNTTNLLESVYFPGSGPDGVGGGWVYNIDLLFSATADPASNPLKVLKRTQPTTATKLHVYVDENLVIRPGFPTGIGSAEVVGWDAAKTLDAGKDDVGEVVEAEMMVDDQTGSKPWRPEWVNGRRRWTAGGVGAVMPVAVLDEM